MLREYYQNKQIGGRGENGRRISCPRVANGIKEWENKASFCG